MCVAAAVWERESSSHATTCLSLCMFMFMFVCMCVWAWIGGCVCARAHVDAWSWLNKSQHSIREKKVFRKKKPAKPNNWKYQHSCNNRLWLSQTELEWGKIDAPDTHTHTHTHTQNKHTPHAPPPHTHTHTHPRHVFTRADTESASVHACAEVRGTYRYSYVHKYIHLGAPPRYTNIWYIWYIYTHT